MTPNLAAFLIAIAIGSIIAVGTMVVVSISRRRELYRLLEQQEKLLARQATFRASGMTIEADVLDTQLDSLARLIEIELNWRRYRL